MAFYSDEEEIWKCSTHPSSTTRRHTGICPGCLRDRLITLCPNCATARPCPCPCSGFPAFSSATASISSSSTSSPFYDLIASSSGLGIVGRVSNLIDNEPPFTRTRSTGINHFLASRFGTAVDPISNKPIRLPPPENRRILWKIWSVLRTQRIKEGDHNEVARKEETFRNSSRPETPVMRRSTSLYHVPTAASKSTTVVKSWKGWYFPSPMKVFRQHKTSKVVQEH